MDVLFYLWGAGKRRLREIFGNKFACQSIQEPRGICLDPTCGDILSYFMVKKLQKKTDLGSLF